MLLIRPDDLSSPQTRGLIARHLAHMRATSPEDSCHALDAEALADPGVVLFSAWEGDEIAGIGGLKMWSPTDAEVKSMRVADGFLRAGVGRSLLRRIIDAARMRGATDVWLETGSHDDFTAAHRLYASEGFSVCGPFADYAVDPHSVFMHRRLDAPGD